MKKLAIWSLCATGLLLSLLPHQVTGKYEKASETKGIEEAFDQSRSSFDFHENWDYCSGTTIEIKHISGKDDYEKDFAKAFELLKKENGGSIKLQHGVYEVSGSVTIPEKCCIRGAGMSKTTIRLKKEAAPYFPSGKKGLLHCSKSSHVSIQALTVDGNQKEQQSEHKYYRHGRYGVSFERCNYAWFRNVRAANNEQYGFFVRGIRGFSSYHALFESVQADGNGLDGMKFRSLMYASVINSIVRDNHRNGVYVTGRSGRILLYNNRLWNNVKCGYKSMKEKGYTPAEVLIEKTLVEKSKKAGICIVRGVDTRIKSSSVRSLDGGACYKIGTSKRVTFLDSKCEGKIFTGKYEGDKCVEGIVEKGVCCALSCGRCGGRKCSERGNCCISDIKKIGKSCKENEAPCSM